MSRYVKEIKSSKSKEEVLKLAGEYLSREGFVPTDYKGKKLWKKGVGVLTAPQYIDLVVNDENTVHIEAFLRYAILPGVYVGEMGLEGFFGFAIKEVLRGRVQRLEALIL